MIPHAVSRSPGCTLAVPSLTREPLGDGGKGAGSNLLLALLVRQKEKLPVTEPTNQNKGALGIRFGFCVGKVLGQDGAYFLRLLAEVGPPCTERLFTALQGSRR